MVMKKNFKLFLKTPFPRITPGKFQITTINYQNQEKSIKTFFQNDGVEANNNNSNEENHQKTKEQIQIENFVKAKLKWMQPSFCPEPVTEEILSEMPIFGGLASFFSYTYVNKK